MLEFLKLLMTSGSTFTVQILKPGDPATTPRLGVISVDATGIVVEDHNSGDEPMCYPWDHIPGLSVEISDDRRTPNGNDS